MARTINSGKVPIPHFFSSPIKIPTYNIFWNKKLLLFSPEHIEKIRQNDPLTNVIALPVLGYDLILRKKKNPQIGIYMKHLVDRSRSFSFTIEEVNRLIIPIKDMNELLSGTSTSFTKTAKQNKQMQA